MHRIQETPAQSKPLRIGDTERCASAAPGSRSVAEAGGRRLQCLVRLGPDQGAAKSWFLRVYRYVPHIRADANRVDRG